MNLTKELAEARAAVAAAGRFILAEYQNFTPIPNAPVTISTHVDRGSQEMILQHLHQAFPGDALIAEEETPTLAASPRGSDRIWIVDPIDGTRGFAMKNGEFSIMVGLSIKGIAVLGVVLEPIRDRETYAWLGGGCWCRVGLQEPTRCQVSQNGSIEQLDLVLSRQKPDKPSRTLRKLKPARLQETFSAGIKLAMVARGETDVYVNSYADFHDWDVCAGQILVEEAGGRVTELDGRPVTYGGKAHNRLGMIGSNGAVHDQVMARLSAPE